MCAIVSVNWYINWYMTMLIRLLILNFYDPTLKISSEQMHNNIDSICHDTISIKPCASMQIWL